MKTFISPIIYCGLKDPEFEMTPEQTVELMIRLTYLKNKTNWEEVIETTLSFSKYIVRGIVVQSEAGPEEFCVQTHGHGICMGQNEKNCYVDDVGLYAWLLSVVQPHLDEYHGVASKGINKQFEAPSIYSIDLTKDYSK